ncbi:hypothetical protein BJ508DRAFT_327423 [Ascobolus immersus RN42]|uniref:C2H2-type domain-containing protein n=1 Tax=Ascobolus immersus RN42 TaxID=1160509 RepID=A0A3N4I6K6_ASCIM|nr:hypothetical protein BJ508DRAFT_327423 [Ascobolus immersus RN42]
MGHQPVSLTPATFVPSTGLPPASATAFVCQQGCDLGFENAATLQRHHLEEHQTPHAHQPVGFVNRHLRIELLVTAMRLKLYTQGILDQNWIQLMWYAAMDWGTLNQVGVELLIMIQGLRDGEALLPAGYNHLDPANHPVPPLLNPHLNNLLLTLTNTENTIFLPHMPARAANRIQIQPAICTMAEHELRTLDWNNVPCIFRTAKRNAPVKKRTSTSVMAIIAHFEGNQVPRACESCRQGDPKVAFQHCRVSKANVRCTSCRESGSVA